jgi:cobyrinic acid a,c-diamide synthase
MTMQSGHATSTRGFVVAAERSGSGKTMITLALAAALQEYGRVQCFKVGPDFIDPGFHTIATGRVSRNLDGWMMGRDACLAAFARACLDADYAVVEGVMGLFDGSGAKQNEGSTAQIARWLNLPVVLVIDAGALAGTAAALVQGLERFDPEVRVAGVIFNRVGSGRHFEYLRDAVAAHCSASVLGYVARDEAWHMPERHLGLVTAEEHADLAGHVKRLARLLCKTVDVGRLRGFLKSSSLPHADMRPAASASGARIAVARDSAFCFCYEDNLDMLRDCGAEIVFFSPLHDSSLPENICGLYLVGGYPELYAGELAANSAMLEQVAAFCASNRPVYAECGGFLYLLQSITDQAGQRHAMAGVFPARALMRARRQRLGYVEVTAEEDCPFLDAGQKIRGHEFHYSDISEMPDHVRRCYTVRNSRGAETRPEGYRTNNVLAGYMHLHFASNIEFARGFAALCRAGAD